MAIDAGPELTVDALHDQYMRNRRLRHLIDVPIDELKALILRQ